MKHLLQQPFIVATGLAALVHSTWALGSLFNGEPPAVALTPEFLYWFIPALLIAFALDVGQIATSHDIREGNRRLAKFATFGILAFATYFLQWLYMAHHMPHLELGAGVRDSWQGGVQLMRDAALWVIPALLPLSTLLYTLSANEEGREPSGQQAAPTTLKNNQDSHLITPEAVADDASGFEPPALLAYDLPLEEVSAKQHRVSCPHCEWSGTYKTSQGAANALRAHLRHCAYATPPVAAHTHTNGHRH